MREDLRHPRPGSASDASPFNGGQYCTKSEQVQPSINRKMAFTGIGHQGVCQRRRHNAPSPRDSRPGVFPFNSDARCRFSPGLPR